jgi:hypothetical protein
MPVGKPKVLLADRGCDGDFLRGELPIHGIRPAIPPLCRPPAVEDPSLPIGCRLISSFLLIRTHPAAFMFNPMKRQDFFEDGEK